MLIMYKVETRQSIWDIALGGTGSLESAMEVIVRNGLAWDDDLGAGGLLDVPSVLDIEVFGYLDSRGIIPISEAVTVLADLPTGDYGSGSPDTGTSGTGTGTDGTGGTNGGGADGDCCSKIREYAFDWSERVEVDYGALGATKMVVLSVVGMTEIDGEQVEFSNRGLGRYTVSYDRVTLKGFVCFDVPTRGTVIFLTN